MSVVIDYSLLSDPSIANSIVNSLNTHLASATLPSFIGPIRITSFDFGDQSPDVEVLGLRDVYRDFLDAEDEEDGDDDDPPDGSDGHHGDGEFDGGRSDDYDGHSRHWGGGARTDVDYASSSSRRMSSASQVGLGMSMGQRGFQYHRPSASVISATPSLPQHRRAPFNPSFSSSPYTSRVGLGSLHNSPIPSPFLSRNPSFSSNPHLPTPLPSRSSSPSASRRPPLGSSSSQETANDPPSSGPPSLQLHLRIQHPSNIRLSLTTTLLINHPSPAFMSLPLQLTVTRLEFDFHLVLAFQASSQPATTSAAKHHRKSAGSRVHISILDELDPQGPPTPSGSPSPAPTAQFSGEGKPLPVGERIIPHMQIESAIGQEGEHVLRNVAKVERFVLDLLRKTIVDELVFPNFHSVAFDF